MDRIIIEGGLPLNGSVRISGAKKTRSCPSWRPPFCRRRVQLDNVPALHDIETMARLIRHMGRPGGTGRRPGGSLYRRLNEPVAPYELVRHARLGFGPRAPAGSCGRAQVSLPGGCAIGPGHQPASQGPGKPWGRRSTWTTATSTPRPQGGLKGTDFFFDQPTVDGHRKHPMAAVLAEGGPCCATRPGEPEVVDLAIC
jgi:UDP-N-acetylglucosamine 1-carboxyvinyltransferase